MDTPTATTSQVTALAAQVNSPTTDDTALRECADTAAALVLRHVGRALGTIPGPVIDRAVVAVGSELWAHRNAPGGVLAAFSDMGAAPVRLARDPMVAARKLLDPWLGHGIGIA